MTKYNELKGIVPEVSSMVDSLKDYKGTDLAGLVSKIQADTTKAQGLYADIMKMMPEGLSLPSVKMP